MSEEKKSKAEQIRELVEGRSHPDARKIAKNLGCPEAYVQRLIKRFSRRKRQRAAA